MAGDGKKTTRNRVKDRLREPSTWAAVAALAAVAAGVPPEVASGVASTIATPQGQATVITAVVAGVLGILLPEKK